MSFTLKRLLPHTLFGRFLLITLVPVVLVQLIAAYAFYQRHWSSVSRHMTASLVGEVEMLAATINHVEPDERENILAIASNTLYLNTSYSPNKKLSDFYLQDVKMFDELEEDFNQIKDFDYLSYVTVDQNIVILVQAAEGVLQVVASLKRIDNPTTYIFILWMTGSAILLAIISILFMRNQIRSIAKLSDAAERFGKGLEMSDFKPTGALEVRKASRAFIEMKERIQKQVSQRTEMLAGISHDLRTPITRIKLQLAMMKQTDDVKDLQQDLQQMEHMVQEYLDFAKGHENTSTQLVNIADLIRSMIASYREDSKKIDVNIQQGLVLALNEASIRRALTNIIDNALRYGEKLNIECQQVGKTIEIIMDDDGPGIPASKREQAFKPFSRLEESRNADRGGAGLGLAITKDAIIRHGGSIELDKSPLGGLRVKIQLPL